MSEPCGWVKPVVLTSHGVTLRPLAEGDLPALYAATPPETFRFYSVPPPIDSLERFSAHMLRLISNPTRLHMAVTMTETGEIVGSTAYTDIKPEHRAMEIGFTWYTPARRGTRVNPACKLLMLGHAIETLGAIRVQIKSDARNLQSQRAIEKLGATWEGRLRRNFIQPDGYARDTVMYSVLPEEWPRVKAGLLARLTS